MRSEWKVCLENLAVIAVGIGLFILTVMLVLVGMDWVDSL